MRNIGFSTGALAYGDFSRALEIIRRQDPALRCVELSALRLRELLPLVEALPHLELSQFTYCSVHAPSTFDAADEPNVLRMLKTVIEYGLPIIVHPDVILDWTAWAEFGEHLYIENMDKRKPTGRTRSELLRLFERLPKSGFCFDIGHAHQVDPTMTEAVMILREFGGALRQVHLSHVNTKSKHERLTCWSATAFRRIADLIPHATPIILETPVTADRLREELGAAADSLAGHIGVAAD